MRGEGELEKGRKRYHSRRSGGGVARRPTKAVERRKPNQVVERRESYNSSAVQEMLPKRCGGWKATTVVSGNECYYNSVVEETLPQ